MPPPGGNLPHVIKKESIRELASVEENPNNTCFAFSDGMMFAVRNGDLSCVTGATQMAGDIVVLGQKFMIYLGGTCARPAGHADKSKRYQGGGFQPG